MTEDVLDFLEENYGKKLRVVFVGGNAMNCIFDGYNYDYDDNDNEIVELTFRNTDNGLYVGATPEEMVSVELIN